MENFFFDVAFVGPYSYLLSSMCIPLGALAPSLLIQLNSIVFLRDFARVDSGCEYYKV